MGKAREKLTKKSDWYKKNDIYTLIVKNNRLFSLI